MNGRSPEMPKLRRLLPVLFLLFVGSGCAALIYEVVWFQLLQLVIGSSAISLGVLLGTYMGGMCAGSLLLPRTVPQHANALKLYGVIEAGIGICGLAVLFGVPRLNGLYADAVALIGTNAISRFPGIILRAAVCATFLLVPTLLMGASLPAIARLFQIHPPPNPHEDSQESRYAAPEALSWLGFFYAGNIVGAVAGSLIAGFYLLRLYDMAIASYTAVAINFVVAAAALILSPTAIPVLSAGSSVFSSASDGQPSAAARSETPEEIGEIKPRPAWPVYLAVGISGLCALGAEVVWTRLLSLMLGATVYTFSIILAVFLAGLGIGSSAGAIAARRARNPRRALAICQFVLAGATAWAAFAISTLIPSPDFNPTLPQNPLDVFRIDLIRCLWAILPAACLWGASFPIALAALAPNETESGSLAGRTYAANTLGAIVGALAFSMIVIPAFGTQASERWLIALSAVAGMIALGMPHRRFIAGSALGAVAAIALIWTVKPVPWLAIAYGRRLNEYTQFNSKPLYIGEGMNSSVVVSEYPGGIRYFHVSGKVEATTEPFDMRLERMLGHLSALFARKPESVLVVGFGAGITAGAFVLHPGVKRITISEIEPLIPPASSKYFNFQNYDVLHDPRTEIHYDDARHYVLTTNETFDVITSDPIHPWVKGTSTLYSKEYFELCKKHLKPGGIVTQWVPLYESDFNTIKSEFATFFEVFPHGTIWNSDAKGEGYDVVLVGQAEPGPIDLDDLRAKLALPDHARVRASLNEVGLGSVEEILATYAGRDDELKPWLYGAQINQDLNMRLQYLAGWGLNFNHADLIYHSFLEYRLFPEGLFTGSPETMAATRRFFTTH